MEFQAVNYSIIIPILIGAVKEQQQMISDLEKKMQDEKKELMGKLELQQQQIDQLTKLVIDLRGTKG